MDTSLYDGVITDALQLLRLQSGEVGTVLQVFDQMQKALRAKLAEGTLTELGARDARRLLSQIGDLITEYTERMQGRLDLEGVATVTAERTQALFVETFATIGVSIPPEPVLKAMAQKALILGAPAQEWWSRQADDLAFKFSNEVRQGIAGGETNDQIVGRIFGQPRKGIPGIMDATRRNAEALVRTSIQTVANQARQATFEANADVVDELQWVTALDGRVCLRCAALADKRWTLDGDPVGHNLPFRPPPIHYNDRCVLVPVTKSMADLGLDLPEPSSKDDVRASATGPVPADTTLEGWMKRNPAQAREILGPGRLQLWQDGKITLTDLIAGNGRPLTLEQLRALSE